MIIMDLLSCFFILFVVYSFDFICATPLVNRQFDRELYYFHKNWLKHGYLMRNRRLLMEEPIIVNGKVVSKHMMNKVMEEDFKFGTTTIKPKSLPRKFSYDTSPICFQIIKHRSLLHSSFYTIKKPVTKNECRYVQSKVLDFRCACAKTWISPDSVEKCMSLHYNPISKSCSLNSANHYGKYDLILDLFNEYHYVSCEPEWLLQIAEQRCQSTPIVPLQELGQPIKLKPVLETVETVKSLQNPLIELTPPQDERVLPSEFGELAQRFQDRMKSTNETVFIEDMLTEMHHNNSERQTEEDRKEKAEILLAEHETQRLFNDSITKEDIERRLNSTYKTKQLLFYLAGLHPEVAPPDDGFFAHDILLTEDQSNSMSEELMSLISGKEKRNAIFFEKLYEQKWDNSNAIPFTIAPNINQTESLLIFNAIRQIESQTCIRFMYSKNRPNESHIFYTKFNSITRCGTSYIGKAKPVNAIYLTFACPNFTSTIMHETLHALGVNHQHMRPDRDSYIDILWNNVNPKNYDYFATVTNKNYTSYGIPYDYGSLLHYGPFTSALNKTIPTMVPKIGVHENFKLMGQKRGLTRYDIELLNKMYCLSSKCVDKSVYCGAWTLINSCSTNSWMQKNCRKSCSLCK